jgi:DNA repair exonuclease SbcCD ATPase subunit
MQFFQKSIFRALLCAGLWFFLPCPVPAVSQADPVTVPAVPLPGRSVIRPEASLAALQNLREELESLKTTIQGLQADSTDEKKSLSALGQRLDQAAIAEEGKKKELLGLRQDLEAEQGMREKLDSGLAALKEDLEASRKKTDQQIKLMEEFRADFEEKRGRLAGVMDLMSAMKKDLNDNSQEIAQLNSQVEALNRKAKSAPEENNVFLQVARWPYLPLAALALSAVAVFVATSR